MVEPAEPPDRGRPETEPPGPTPAEAGPAVAAAPVDPTPAEAPPIQPPPIAPRPSHVAPVEAPPLDVPPVEAPRAYELPTARKVVSSGLQLALASTSELRRASIYIGLLVLGAFGPTVIGVLLIVGRLGDQAGDTLGGLFLGTGIVGPPQPALEAALLIVALEALVGLVLFVAISIDAGVMAIAILGGRAADRPLTMPEAIVRARQTFWRMLGAGTLVGFASTFIQLLIGSALGGLSQSVEAADVVAAILATVIVAPLAYVSTSIVLGDVGAMEALSRSWRLFRVRQRLAIVVVLFTLVTSAIQLFALSAGLDLVTRAGELLHVSLTEGAVAFAVALVLVLAAVVAYGSLMFTIGAVVSAPQVAGFLGLTFFSGGLDRARIAGPKPPTGFRYVTRPMLVAIIALAGVTGLEIPAINSIERVEPTPGAVFLRSAAEVHEFVLSPFGYLEPTPDQADDQGAGSATADIVLADYGTVPIVPDWLVNETFSCDQVNVACGAAPLTSTFDDGAYLFVIRTAGDTAGYEGCAPCDLAATLAMLGEERAPSDAQPYAGASMAFSTRLTRQRREVSLRRWNGISFYFDSTHARSRWDGPDVAFLIPLEELDAEPVSWNVQTSATIDGATAEDRLGTATTLMLPFEQPPDLWLDPASDFAP